MITTTTTFGMMEPHWAPPDWRWQKCVELSRRRGRRRRDEDPLVLQAVPLVRAYLRFPDDPSRAKRLVGDGLAVDTFWSACSLVQPESFRARIEVEARLLAGQSPEEIGRCCELDPETVHWHEVLRFDVRDRLSVEWWVTQWVLGELPADPSVNQEDEHLLKLLAWSGGPLYVNRALDYLHKRSRAEDYVRGSEELSLNEQLDFLRVHCLALMATMPQDDRTSEQFLQLFPLLQQWDAGSAIRGEAPSYRSILPDIEAMLQDMEIRSFALPERHSSSCIA